MRSFRRVGVLLERVGRRVRVDRRRTAPCRSVWPDKFGFLDFCNDGEGGNLIESQRFACERNSIMRVKFSGALVLAMACTGMCVFSAVPYTPMSENVWQGPATGGDWNANDNWSLAAPPSGERCFAKFTSSATVTPPADFVGVLWVSGNGVAVTADVPASASFALRLSNAESLF